MSEKEKNTSGQTQEAIYQKALEKLEADKLTVQSSYKAANLERAAQLFDTVSDYADAADLASRCRQMADAARKAGREDQLKRTLSRAKVARKDDEWAKVEENLEKLQDMPEAQEKLTEVRSRRRALSRRSTVKRSIGLTVLAALALLAGLSVHNGAYRYGLGRLFALAKMDKPAAYEFRNAKNFADSEAQLRLIIEDKIRSAGIGEEVEYGTQKWVVLDRDEERILLIAADLGKEDMLYGLPFNRTREETSWAECSLREYLNGTFLETAFTEEERAHLLVQTSEDELNYLYDTAYEDSTSDYVTILDPTQVGLYREVIEHLGLNWWLRAPGEALDTAQFMTADHQAMTYGYPVDYTGMYARAVIALDASYFAGSEEA